MGMPFLAIQMMLVRMIGAGLSSNPDRKRDAEEVLKALVAAANRGEITQEESIAVEAAARESAERGNATRLSDAEYASFKEYIAEIGEETKLGFALTKACTLSMALKLGLLGGIAR